MALGTMTLVKSAKGGETPLFVDVVTLVGDGTYSSGGSTGVKAKLNALTKDTRTPVAVVLNAGGAFTAQYDYANEKLIVRNAGDGAEAAANQSGNTYTLTILSV